MYYRDGKNLVENFEFPKPDKKNWLSYLMYLLVLVVVVLAVVYGIKKYRENRTTESFGYRFY